MKIIAVIPARYKSSRFPGKPLSDICGKPMIWWVYQHCKCVSEFSNVYVATDDQRIYDCCADLGIDVLMTSEDNPTGTDRVAEVAEKKDADMYVNVQGDEPLLETETISYLIKSIKDNPGYDVYTMMTKIDNPVDVVNNTIPKVITNENNEGIYITRCAAPFPKGSLDYSYYKQVCAYGFSNKSLRFYKKYGKEHGKSKIEKIEDIELLRFIENGYKIKFFEVNTDTVAVDTEKDLEKVRAIMKKKLNR